MAKRGKYWAEQKLGLRDDYTMEGVNARRRFLIAQLHPDKVQDAELKRIATEIVADCNAAADILKKLFKDYDGTIRPDSEPSHSDKGDVSSLEVEIDRWRASYEQLSRKYAILKEKSEKEKERSEQLQHALDLTMEAIGQNEARMSSRSTRLESSRGLVIGYLKIAAILAVIMLPISACHAIGLIMKAPPSQQHAAAGAETDAREMVVRSDGSSIRIRSAPTVESDVLDTVGDGETVSWSGAVAEGLGGSGNIVSWSEVTSSDGVTGWMVSAYLAED